MPVSILDGEELLTFSQVATLLPRRRGGSTASTSTIWRWTRRGSRGVILRVVRVGGHVYVPRSALIEFIEQRSEVGHTHQQPSPKTASDRAMRQLGRMGL